MQGGLALYKKAAELGHVMAQWSYGRLAFAEDQPERYVWCGMACARGMFCHDLINDSERVFALVRSGMTGSVCKAAFVLGDLFVKHTDSASQTVFGKGTTSAQWAFVSGLMDLYRKWEENAKNAIMCWTICASRLKLYKDVRQIISKLLWKEKMEWSHQERREELIGERQNKRQKRSRGDEKKSVG